MLSVSNLSKIQGGEILYSGVSFQINPGEKVGLVGPNGSGKTTLFRMIIGEDRPNEGQIKLSGKNEIGLFFSKRWGTQWRDGHGSRPIRMTQKLKIFNKNSRFSKNSCVTRNLDPDEMNKVLERMGETQTEFEKRGGYDLEQRAEEILTGLGIMPFDHQKLIQEFSGGWKMRIALARVLVMKPDLIIMDEPTNYLDIETILWLEDWLNNYEGAVFMTTHDRAFMNNVCKKIIEVNYRQVTTYSGNYDFYETEKELRLSQLKSEAKRQAESIAKDEDFIAKFKARASHAAQVQSRVKKLEKIQRIEIPPEEETIDFEFNEPPRGGDEVVIIKNLKKTWPLPDGSENLIFEGLSTTVKRLDKIAVVGVNGAGKSTLLKIICNQTKGTGGEVKVGDSIKLGYFSQFSFDVLGPENTVLEEVQSGLPNASDGFLRNLLARFSL